MPPKSNGVSLAEARAIIQAGQAKATDLGTLMNIAVVDAGGNLLAFERQEGAWLGAFDITTKDLGDNSQSGDQFFGIHVSNGGRIMIFAGGVPLYRAGEVIGAVGVSGPTGKNAHAVAEAAAKGYEK